jgi:hypothetical protein
MVPAPSGILAVGEGAVGERVFVPDLGGDEGSVAGEMGFILRPLMPPGFCAGGGGITEGGGPGSAERGVGGSTLSLCFSEWGWAESGNIGVLRGQ